MHGPRRARKGIGGLRWHCSPETATRLSGLVDQPLGFFLLEVTEDRPRIDAEVARRLRAVAVVAIENLLHVAALPLFARLRERKDRLELFRREIQVLGTDHRLVGEDDGLLDAVLELPHVAGPVVLSDRDERVRREADDLAVELARELPEQVLREHDDV